MIIDCHGHYTTAPKALEDWRSRQIAGIKDPSARPRVSELRISDDELRGSIEKNQLKQMKERGSDLTIFSPRDRIGDPYEHDGSGTCLPPQGSHRERTTCQDDLRW
jgi:hypothetical protein